MSGARYFSLFTNSAALREVAAERTDNAAVTINAINGAIVMAAMAVPLHASFTIPLIILLCLLFGPLIGFIVSSLYARVEATVGRMLGGRTALDQVYPLFAWSFFPVACAILLNSLVFMIFKPSSSLAETACLLPSVIIICLAIKHYCGNLISAQGFTRARGISASLLSLILFVVLAAGGLTGLSLLLKYMIGENMSILLQQL